MRIANGTRIRPDRRNLFRSPGNIDRARREFRVGNLYINRKITGALVDRQPFGGFKLSGGGTKAGGSDYLLNFLLDANDNRKHAPTRFRAGVGRMKRNGRLKPLLTRLEFASYSCL